MARWTKAFFNFLWKNWPSVDSPVNASNLNKQNNAIEEIDSRVLFLDDVKLDASKADVMVKDVLLDEDTGILKVIHYNGDTDTYSSLLSKIAINFDFDRETQKIILYLRDGTPKEIDLSEFIMEYEFVKSDTISFSVSKREDIFDLEVPAGGIGYNSAQRFSMKEEAGKTITAEAEMDLAEISGTWKKRGSSETLTINFFPDELLPNRVFTAFLDGTWETISVYATATADAGGKVSVYFSKGGEVSAEVRKGSITEEHLRPDYLADIRLEASKAEASKNAAAEKADDSAKSALLSKSYSDGTSGVRDGEATDNAKYYKEQAKAYYDSLTQSGNVTGVKGSAESTYRTGNVELTAANIGAVPAAGGNFTGNVVFDKYMTLRAWEGYGSGSANFWYNGNSKTIDFEGDVKNIDLNATSATNADTVDGKHASDLQNFNNLTNNPISKSIGNISSSGWYKVAKVKDYAYQHGNYIEGGCVISIARTYSSPSPEYQNFRFICAWNNCSLEVISAVSDSHIWTKARVIKESNGDSFIEIYQNVNSNQNMCHVFVCDQSKITGMWVAMTPTPDTASPTVVAEMDLPSSYTIGNVFAKKDGSNASGTWEITATKATQDGNGNNIASTYVKKNEFSYKDISSYMTSYSSYFEVEEAYCENGVVVIRITMKSGSAGSGNAGICIKEETYKPRAVICGNWQYISANDIGKLYDAHLSDSGYVFVYSKSVVSGGAHITFVYPARTT